MELTKAEKKWVKQVNALLAKCPSDRLGFLASGDRYVAIYDRKEHYQNICDSGIDPVLYLNKCDGHSTDRITFPEQVEAVCA